MSQTLARHDTLRRRADFEKVRAEGKRKHGAYLSINWMRTGGTTRQFAIIVPKKIGHAVDRNRIKRRTREIYRKMQGQLPSGLVSIWIAKASARLATFDQIRQDMNQIYQGIIR